jgi:hypothetical protein
MWSTAGGSVRSESKGTESQKRPLLMDEGHVPDFFDHWMEEYISKVAADQPATGQQTQEHTDKTEADGKETQKPHAIRGGKDEPVDF